MHGSPQILSLSPKPHEAIASQVKSSAKQLESSYAAKPGCMLIAFVIPDSQIP